RRDLTLAKCGIQRVVNDLGRDSQPSRRVPIDHEPRFQSTVLQIRIRVTYLRKILDPVQHDSGPFLNLFDRVTLNGVLELRVAASAADSNLLRRLKEETGARKIQLRTETSDHLVRRDITFAQRFQLNLKLAVASGSTDRSRDILDSR